MTAAFTSTFTTGPVPDLYPAVCDGFDPANGVTGVPTNAVVRVGFNKPWTCVTGRRELAGISVRSVRGVGDVGAGESVRSRANGQSRELHAGGGAGGGDAVLLLRDGVVDLEGQPLAQNGQTLSCFTDRDGDADGGADGGGGESAERNDAECR